jgi:tetratricopeptide (TPR) repeat protein
MLKMTVVFGFRYILAVNEPVLNPAKECSANMEKLFSLVKSLNGMEKRYFKLAVSVHKASDSKNYMRLFNAISRQRVYDDAALRREFAGERIISRFDMSKNYLYRLLLNTLQNYHRNSSVQLQLINMLNKAVILSDKMLYKSSLEILQKARQLAKKYEYYEMLLRIIQMMQRIATEERKDDSFIEQFQQEYEYAVLRIQKINEYHKLYHHLYAFFSKKGNDLRAPGLRKQYSQFLRHPLLSGKQKPNGHEEKSYYYLARSLCYFCMGRADKSYHYTQQRLNLIKSRPEKITEDPATYIVALNSVIFYGSVLCKIKESENAFDKLQNFMVVYPARRHKLFIAYDNMMALYLTAGRFREGLVYAKKAEEELPFFEDRIFATNKVSLYHDMFYIYFGCREYEHSLKWLNKLLNETTFNAREDIQVTARLTNLIVHYELKNFELLPYLIRRTYNFLYKRKRLHKLEKILLQFIGKLLRVNPHVRKEITALFTEIKTALDEVTKDPSEAMVLTEYFDYTSWLESKIANRSFERIVRDKSPVK